jgi:hypothetical protein
MGDPEPTTNWAPVVETVMRPLEYGMPPKVKFQFEHVLESFEDLGWNDVVPRGATNLDEDSDPAFDDSLRTNQLAINLKLMMMNAETLEMRLTKGLVSYEEALESLGIQVHATRVQVGNDSGIYTSGEDSLWEGIAGVHNKVDSVESRIRSDIMSEIMPMIGQIKSDATAGTAALVEREVAVATRQLSSQLQAARREHSVTVSNIESDLARLVGRGELLSGQYVAMGLAKLETRLKTVWIAPTLGPACQEASCHSERSVNKLSPLWCRVKSSTFKKRLLTSATESRATRSQLTPSFFLC